MTQNEILSHELLSFLSSYPRQLKTEGHPIAGKLAVSLGNAILALSYNLEKDKPQLVQPLEESPLSLFALGKQFREVGLILWDKPAPVTRLESGLIDGIRFIETRLANIEKAVIGKGGRK